MAVLNIPESEYEVLKRLSKLTEVQFSELVNALNAATPAFLPSAFSKTLADKTPSIPRSEVASYIRLLGNLYPAKEYRKKTAEDIANDLKETIENEKPDGFPLDQLSQLKARLKTLLSIDKAIAVTAKAIDIATDRERLCCGVKILSDVRAVFSGPADSISVALIIHTLNISYHEGADHKEFYVALDKEDIRSLKEALERAEKKENLLQSAIQKAGISYLEEGA